MANRSQLRTKNTAIVKICGRRARVAGTAIASCDVRRAFSASDGSSDIPWASARGCRFSNAPTSCEGRCCLDLLASQVSRSDQPRLPRTLKTTLSRCASIHVPKTATRTSPWRRVQARLPQKRVNIVGAWPHTLFLGPWLERRFGTRHRNSARSAAKTPAAAETIGVQ